VLHTGPRQEQTLALRLEARDFEAYAPLYAEGDKQPALVFPRYIFCRPCDDETDIQAIQYVPGLENILAQGGAYAQVADTFVQQIKSFIHALEQGTTAGQHVEDRVPDQKLREQLATLVNSRSITKRNAVLFELLQHIAR
jgi:hypothetical protein